MSIAKTKAYIKNNYIFLIFCVIILFFISLNRDSDEGFIIATGQNILKNGIQYKNPFCNYYEMPVVVQQWLWCVIVALFYKLGNFGLFILSMLIALLIVTLSTIFINDKINDISISIMISVLALKACGIISCRPEAITTILIIIECILLEKYTKTGRKKYLYYIIPLSVAELNLHSSMHLIHYMLMLPYCFPYNLLERKFDIKSKKDFIIPMFLMGISGCISPYGYNSALYLINTYRAGISQYQCIDEMSSVSIFSGVGIFFLVMSAMFFYLLIKNKINCTSFYMILGLSILVPVASRNIFLYHTAALYIMREMDIKNIVDVSILNKYKRQCYVVIAILSLFFIMNSLYLSKLPDYETECPNIVNYLNENTKKKDIKLYTDYNYGSYMELNGYNVFIDSRMEFYFPTISKGCELADDSLSVRSVYYVRDRYNKSYPDKEIIQKFLDKYSFDYMIIGKNDTYLQAYLDMTDKYRKIMQENDNAYIYLYKKTNSTRR